MRHGHGSQFTRRHLLTALLASSAFPAVAGAPLTSERPPRGRNGTGVSVPGDDVLVAKARVSGDVAYAVADAETGEVLEARAPFRGQAPASVTKAITALYALDALGAGHRFTTQVIATGGIDNGIVAGDLILVAGGDPVMDTRDLSQLAASLKESGVREVRGAFKVYEGPYPQVKAIDPGQPDHLGYNPAVSAIALNFNRVHFEWKRAGSDYTVTMDARAGSYRPAVDVAQMQVVDRGAPVYTYRDSGRWDSWTVARGALGREGARWLPVRHPGLYAADVFATLARSQGIVLRAATVTDALPTGRTVAKFESAPLSEILRGMLKYSNNLTAEMVGLAATHARIGKVGGLVASAAEMNTWASETLGMVTAEFVDHSGLGGDSRISARDMVRGLSAVGHASLLRPLLKPVKLLDGQGRPTNNHPVKAEAKTGTLNFVSGLAGYVTAPSGRELVFAIFTQDQDIRAGITRAQRERPRGARTWATRSRRLQRQLIMRWGSVFANRDQAMLETDG